MKKYISIVTLVTAFSMQSCERSDSDLNALEEKQNTAILSRKESAGSDDFASEEGTTGNFQEESDDPPRDKQHWRVIKDTVR